MTLIYGDRLTRNERDITRHFLAVLWLLQNEFFNVLFFLRKSCSIYSVLLLSPCSARKHNNTRITSYPDPKQHRHFNFRFLYFHENISFEIVLQAVCYESIIDVKIKKKGFLKAVFVSMSYFIINVCKTTLIYTLKIFKRWS